MLKNFLESEWLLPVSDYIKISSVKEYITKKIFLVIIVIACAITLFYYNYKEKTDICVFINSFIDIGIQIVALLLSFSIAYLTILITSENDSIKKLQLREYTKKIDGATINLYQFLLNQLTYTIFNEIVLLILYLIIKFILPTLSIKISIVLISICNAILINIIMTIFSSVKNIYLAFWNPNEKYILK